MKKLLLASAFFITAYFSFCQIPNAGMEYWDNEPVLLFWQTNSRPLTLPPWDPYIIKKDTDAFSGNYAADFYANGFLKAYAIATFPVSFHPQNLTLYYKLSFAPCVNDNGYPQQDTVSVSVELLNQGVVVDNGYWETKAGTAFYTQLIIPVSQNATVFDSCRITIMGGRILGGCGIVAAPTEFRVDELQLKYSNASACIDTSQICLSCHCITIYNPVCGCDGNSYGNSCEAYYAGVTSWTQGTCGSITGCIDSAQICDTCPCPLLYDPVCGCDGKTYSNSCFAYNAGLTSWTQGGCGGNACRADFYYTGSTIIPSTIQYHDISSGNNITGWEWTFSDGTFSTQQNPTITYNQPGPITACLKITSVDTSGTCTDSICQTIIISDSSGTCINPSLICDTCACPAVYDPVCGCDGITYDNSCMAQNAGVVSWTQGACGIITPCEAYYYYWSDTSGYIVHFEYASGWLPISTDSSRQLLWHFGDGDSSTALHPVHTYTDTSIHSYWVCLTVTDTLHNCSNMYCDSVYVDRRVYGCYAGFTYTIDSTGVVVVYPDSTSGISSGWTWVIDSIGNPVNPNPSFQVDSNSNYPVCYIVVNDSLACTDTVCILASELYAEFRAMGYKSVSKDVSQFYLYPNPAAANAELRFTISTSGKADIVVRNILGETVYQFPAAKLAAGSYTYRLNTEPFSSGIYLVELKLNGSTASVRKLIRQ